MGEYFCLFCDFSCNTPGRADSHAAEYGHDVIYAGDEDDEPFTDY